MIHVSGKGLTPAKIDRAIALSLNKYCSVYHSLRKDLAVNVKYEIGGLEGLGGEFQKRTAE
jgi:uncharacterized OsmC-like protein